MKRKKSRPILLIHPSHRILPVHPNRRALLIPDP